MYFSYTHHMPYTDIRSAGQDWPVANKQFDAEKGVEMMRAYIDDKVYSEQTGFDWIGSNEHHMSPYGLMPNPNLVGAIVASRTTRAGILQSGNIIPIVNPIRVAEEYAMIDVISGGRLVAGFMRGIPHEYVAYHKPPSESYARMAEAVELIKKCWSEPEPFGWEGEFYQYRAVSIWPPSGTKALPADADVGIKRALGAPCRQTSCDRRYPGPDRHGQRPQGDQQLQNLRTGIRVDRGPSIS